MHTSGHADRTTILKTIKTINPKEVIVIHKDDMQNVTLY